eukprot:maker-scaffold410_size180147-snap-gene-0.30 protein:Tk11883 transcript:maker-scaffold410_size180147-snap-gene-0.30-mRNA-1 annotation:"mfs-type transporter c6orf192 homolog"
MVCDTLRGFSRRQWLTVIVFSIVQFCQAICVSLQAPFYPQEAEKKGATPTAYGLVFGVFELTVFLVSPWIGQNIHRLGGKRFSIVNIMVCDTLRGFSRRQWLTVIVFSIVQFCQAICVSLQAPFYPQEAEKKGATPTAYGLVFGVFELTVFLVSPWIGQNIHRLGGKRVFNTGIFTTGFCSIFFGLLDRVENGTLFIALSFVIRIVEAVGNSMFLCAAFSITAQEFPENVATMFAIMETFFGVGLIVGPTVGGALYEVAGYYLPFVSLGSCLVLSACLTLFLLPSNYDEDDQDKEEGTRKGMMAALQIPSIAISVLSILCASASVGFLLTTLEPHMRQFHLSPLVMGAMFVINGGCYALTAPIFGIICDKWSHPQIVNYIGVVCIIISFTLLGPAPFLPFPTHLSTCIIALVAHGCGLGATLVSGFSMAHREAVKSGFPDNFETHGLISGLWTSVFALGAFIGPSVAGVLLQHFGMRYASQFIVVFGVSVLAITLLFAWVRRRFWRNIGSDEYEPIVTDDQLGPNYGSRHGRSPSIGYNSGASGPSSSNASPPEDGEARSLRNIEGSSSSAVRASSGPRHQRTGHPMSPKSPLQSGATGLLGGVCGYSIPIHHGADGHHEIPHVIIEQNEEEFNRAPTRNTRSQQRVKRSRKSSTNPDQ